MLALLDANIHFMENDKKKLEAECQCRENEIKELEKRINKLRKEYKTAMKYDTMNPCDKMLFLKFMWTETDWHDFEELHIRCDKALLELAGENKVYEAGSREAAIKAYEELQNMAFCYA